VVKCVCWKHRKAQFCTELSLMSRRKLQNYPEISLKLEDLTGPVEMEYVFGRSGAVHIEIGSGKGTYLLNSAKANPGINFLGIEWANKYYRYAVDRMGRWEIKNVRLIRAEAARLIAEYIGDDCVECFHVYFPDPWPKKRHHKRRFFNQANLDQMLRCLVVSGTIRIATDHTEYFEVIAELLKKNNDSLKEIDFFPSAGAEKGEWVGTNFERKYLKQKRNIYTIAVEKTVSKIYSK